MNDDNLEITVNGLVFTYTKVDCISVGDYGGAGSVGEANLRYVRDTLRWEYLCRGYDDQLGLNELVDEGDFDATKPLQALIRRGDYSSAWGYILSDVQEENPSEDFDPEDDVDGFRECRDLLSGLEGYSVIDEDLLYEVEEEWKEEAWNCWLASDISRAVSKLLPEELADKFDDLSDDALRLLFIEAHYQNGIGEFVPEYSGMYFNGIDAVAEFIRSKLEG